MTTSFDITVLSISREGGSDRPYHPGVYVAKPPRRAARGRRHDRLILFVTFDGIEQVSPEQHKKLLVSLEKRYYQTSGTVTSALRALAQDLNQFLLARNLRVSTRRQQVVGQLDMAVVREDHLYFAQSGPSHGFLLTSGEIQHFHDPQTAGRGLGISRQTLIHFYQSQLSKGASLVILPKLPADWNPTTLQNAYGQNLSALRRRLLSQAGANLAALVIQAQPGSGQTHYVRPTELTQKEASPSPRARATAEKRPPATPSRLARRTPQSQSWEPLDATSPQGQSPDAQTPESAVHTAPIQAEASPYGPVTTRRSRPRRSIGPALLTARRQLSNIVGKLGRWLQILLGRLLPGEGVFSLPTHTMAITAIAVPLIVVVIAMTVYLQVGRQTQYQTYLSQAKIVAEQAAVQTDPAETRLAWESTLFYLEMAEQYQQNEETQSIREQAQSALDALDEITRLDFQPALGSTLAGNLNITRLAATGSDLYLLDANSGSVLHARLTGSGKYELDTSFNCSPGMYGGLIVSELIDLTALPSDNPEGADILVMDANGNILYCFNESNALHIQLVTPASDWGDPRAMQVSEDSLGQESLYVLDPFTRAVWVYQGGESGFRDPSALYFSGEVPSSMAGIIDLTMRGDQLYMLHDDGHMVICDYGAQANEPTVCTDPAVFTDERSGHESGSQIDEARFTQITYSPPPEPSIYLLDPLVQAIYRFSVNLRFDRQYRPSAPLADEPATAFAISPTKVVFLAVRNQVYSAFLTNE